MKNVAPFFDERNKAWCIHCSTKLAHVATNRDHIPSKCLLPRPLPANTPVIEICQNCNSSFSADEEYFAAVLTAVEAGSLQPDPVRYPVGAEILANNARLRRELEQCLTPPQRDLFDTPTKFTLYPDADRIRKVVLKNARGHAFFEFGEPMMEKPTVCNFVPLELLDASARERFEFGDGNALAVWPEVGSRMMTRMIEGTDLVDGWVIVSANAYRYAVDLAGGIRVRTVVHEYLATEVVWSD